MSLGKREREREREGENRRKAVNLSYKVYLYILSLLYKIIKIQQNVRRDKNVCTM
jgi:hypothetical protein